MKIKAINQQSSSLSKYNNRISIFNIKQLNKIFNVQQNLNNEEEKSKNESKPKTQRNMSLNFKTSRKISTSQSARNSQK